MRKNIYKTKHKFVLISLIMCALSLASCKESSRQLSIDKDNTSFPLTVGAAYRIAQNEIEKETSEYYISTYVEDYPNWQSVINNSPIYTLYINTRVNGNWKNVWFTMDSATGENEFFPNQGNVPRNEEFVVDKLPDSNYQLYALLTQITEKLDTDIQTLLLSKSNSPSFYVNGYRGEGYYIIQMDDNSTKDPREILSIEYDSALDTAKVFERDYSKVTPTPQA